MITLPIGYTTSSPSIVSHGTEVYFAGLVINGVMKCGKYESGTIVELNIGVGMTEMWNILTDDTEIYSMAGYGTYNELVQMDNTSTGVSKMPSNDLVVYPNPSTGIVYFSEYHGKYKVYSPLGSVVFQGIGSRHDFCELKAGMYFIKLGDKTHRVAIQH